MDKTTADVASHLEKLNVSGPNGGRKTVIILVQEILMNGIILEASEPLEAGSKFFHQMRGPDGVMLCVVYQVHKSLPIGPRRWCVQAGFESLEGGECPMIPLSTQEATASMAAKAGRNHRAA